MRQKALHAAHALWQERVKFLKYIMIGFSSLGVDYLVYLSLTRGIETDKIPANIASVAAGGVYTFFLNKYWAFQNRANTLRQSRRFFALFVFNYVFQQIAFAWAVTYTRVPDVAIKAVLIACMVSWNFLLYRYWIYAAE